MFIISALESLKQKKLCNFKTSLGYHGILGQPGLQCAILTPPPKKIQLISKNPISIINKTQQATIITLP